MLPKCATPIVQLGYNSVHIANPYSSLFYPHCSNTLPPFHLMWPRINIQNILDPLCICIKVEVRFSLLHDKQIDLAYRLSCVCPLVSIQMPTNFHGTKKSNYKNDIICMKISDAIQMSLLICNLIAIKLSIFMVIRK